MKILLVAFLLPVALANGAGPLETTAIVSRIKRQPVVSTALASVGYSKRLHALEIEFVNGAIYRYLGVEAPTYRELLAAESKAHYYDENIRGRYRSFHVRRRLDY